MARSPARADEGAGSRDEGAVDGPTRGRAALDAETMQRLASMATEYLGEGLERGEAEEEDGRRRQGAGLRVNGGDEADEVAVGGHGARARLEELGGSGARGWKKLLVVPVLNDGVDEIGRAHV